MASGRMEFASQEMAQHTNFCFVLPNDVSPEERAGNPCYGRPAKTAILLHGYTGTDTDWMYGGCAQQLAIDYNLNVFMPTAGNNFYLNRPWQGERYCDFVGVEFPEYIHRTFGVPIEKENLILGGFSMGGYGALHTALSFPERFGGCIALSSADIVEEISGMKPGDARGIAPCEYYSEVFGDLSKVADTEANLRVLYRKKAAALTREQLPPIYMAIGTEDFLYEHNQQLRRFLESEGARFTYEEGPGVHNWAFWKEYARRGLAWILEQLGSRSSLGELKDL